MKLYLDIATLKKIKIFDERKKVRTFDHAEIERRFNEVLDLRHRLYELGGCDKDTLKAPFTIDLTYGLPVYHAGRKKGIAVHPAGDFFKIAWNGEKWKIVDAGRW